MANYNNTIIVNVLTAAPDVTAQPLGTVMLASTATGFTSDTFKIFAKDSEAQVDSEMGADLKKACSAFFAQRVRPPELMVGKVTLFDSASLSALLVAVRDTGTDFYGLLIDSNTLADIEAANTWALAQEFKLFGYCTRDSAVADGTASNVMENLHGAAADSWGVYHDDDAAYEDEYPDIALMSYKLAANPDERLVAWYNARLVGVSAQDKEVDSTQLNNIEGYNGMVYLTLQGIPVMRNGKLHSGVWVDEKISVDWLTARLKEDLAQLAVDTDSSQEFLDPHNGGLGKVYDVVANRVETAEGIGHIAPDRTEIIMPRPENVTNRNVSITVRGVMHGGMNTFSVTAQLV